MSAADRLGLTPARKIEGETGHFFVVKVNSSSRCLCVALWLAVLVPESASPQECFPPHRSGILQMRNVMD